MILNSDSMKPIYIQIAEWIETEILGDEIQAHEKVYSQYQLAEMYNINPATAGKGLTMLVDEGVLYKKRGLGMFVSEEAQKIILSKRKNQTLASLIKDLVKEASFLHVSEQELLEMLKLEMKKGEEK
ncbi:GntR family transcriptional regulator [Rossellomorea aquimaris]|uniref:GntR family transcriptional regulator n=1 Tax=Rossellomorea aquimaris TaxID=189382 RepID=UPI000AF71BE2|nr:GntR family transcriptional regulator [Rossellomorea aquimaris]